MYQHYCMNQHFAAGSSGLFYQMVCDARLGLTTVSRCSDGTIRNPKNNNCLQTVNADGTGDIHFDLCILYPEIPENMLWTWESQGTVRDKFSMIQQKYTITNKASGLHLMSGDWDAPNMTNTFYVYMSKDKRILAHNSWFFRNRGKALKTGQMMTNLDSCLHYQVSNSFKYAHPATCPDDDQNFLWTFYENGEIAHNETNMVLSTISTTRNTIKLVPTNYD